MYGIAIFDSGNYAYSLARRLEEKGYVFEIVPVPCQIAKNGCSQCIKFPIKDIEILLSESLNAGIFIREIFEIRINEGKTEYNKIRAKVNKSSNK